MSETDEKSWSYDDSVKSWKERLTERSKMTSFDKFLKLPAALEEGQYYAFFDENVFGLKTLFDDDLCYYWVENGKRMKPRLPPAQKFEGVLVRRSVSKHISGHLERMVVCHENKTLVVYTVSEKCLISNLQKRKKISDNLSEKVKDALRHRSAKAAQKTLEEQGITIFNQSSNVSSRLKSERGPVPINVEDSIANHASEQECATFTMDSDTNRWRYMEVFKKPLQLFVRNCPKRSKVENFRADLQGLDDEENKEDTKALLLSKFKGGTCRYSSVLELDTTFSFGNFYITFIIGYTNHFQTRTSNKPRPLILAIMIHQSKGSSEHAEFAKFFSNSLNKADDKKNRVVTALVTDAEAAFSEYMTNEGVLSETKHLKCGLHLRSNFEKDLKKHMSDKLVGKVFGRKVRLESGEDLLENSLLSSLNRFEFEKRMEKLEKKVHQKVFKWIKKREDNLYDSYCMRAQLEGLLCKQYCTSNIIENLNGKLKKEINLNSEAVEVLRKFSGIVEEEYRNFIDSILTDNTSNPVVYYKLEENPQQNTFDESIKKLLSAGVTEADLAFHKVPFSVRQLLPKVIRDKPICGFSEFVVDQVNGRYFVRKDNTTCCVEKVDETWKCDSCSLKKTYITCIHLVVAQCSFDESDRDSSFRKTIEKLENESAKARKRRNREYRFGLKTPKRKFTQLSSNNQFRNVDHIGNVSKKRKDVEFDGIENLFNDSGTAPITEVSDIFEIDVTQQRPEETSTNHENFASPTFHQEAYPYMEMYESISDNQPYDDEHLYGFITNYLTENQSQNSNVEVEMVETEPNYLQLEG